MEDGVSRDRATSRGQIEPLEVLMPGSWAPPSSQGTAGTNMMRSYHVNYRHKRQGFETTLRDVFTVGRVGFVVFLCGATFAFYRYVDQERFTVTVGHHLKALSRKSCQAYCESTLESYNFEKEFGGKGVCRREVGNRTEQLAKFELCVCLKRAECKCRDVKEWDLRDMVKSSSDEYQLTRCTFRVVVSRWKPGFVAVVTAGAVFMVVQGMPAELCFLICCCLFVATEIITPTEGFSGLSSLAVVSVAFLFPLTKALDDTGLLTKIALPLLGSPSTQFIGVLRFNMLVMLITGVMANPPLVVSMIPLAVKFSRRLGCHPGKLLIPLSYSVMAGCNLTIMGSVCGLLVQQLVKPAYNMGIFDMFFSCLVVGLVQCFACAFLSTTRILKSSNASEDKREFDASCGPLQSGEYEIDFVVVHDGVCDGAEAAHVFGELLIIPGIRSVFAQDQSFVLFGGQTLAVRGNPEALARVRRLEGLVPSNIEELAALGSHRRGRGLYEGVVAQRVNDDWPFSSVDPGLLLDDMGLVLLASRGAGGQKPWVPASGGSVGQGDLLLFEAHSSDIAEFKGRYDAAFGLIRAVQNSEPPRFGHKYDYIWARFVFCVFLGLITLASFNLVKLHYGAGLALVLLLTTGQIQWQQALNSVSVPVLIIIGAGIGVGNAIDKTGITTCVADVAVAVGSPFGVIGLAAAIYIVCASLGLFLHQGAIVAMITPVILEMTESSEHIGFSGMRALVHVMMLSSSYQICNPLTPPNLFITKVGEFALSDFPRFGVLLQLIHAFCCIFLVPFLIR